MTDKPLFPTRLFTKQHINQTIDEKKLNDFM